MSWPAIALGTIIIFWASLFLLLTKWPRVSNRSISHHAARFNDSYIFFTSIQVIAGFILYIFVIRWFVPTFHMSLLFTFVYSVTAWLQIVSALIRDTKNGVKSLIHLRLANAFAIGMFITTLLICLAPSINGVPKLLFCIAALYMLFCVILISFKKGKPHLVPNYLVLQVTYIVIFQVALLFVVFSK